MKNRVVRVCEIVKRELGSIIPREIDFGPLLVTISSVDMTPDLKQAHIRISVLGPANQRGTVLHALEDNRILLQTELSKRIKIKHTPHLHFHIDDTLERGDRVLGIMDELGLLPHDPRQQ
jgi:ribosome-binding factor A